MKKYISMLIAAALIFAVSGCVQKDEIPDEKDDDKPIATAQEIQEDEEEESAVQTSEDDDSADDAADGDWNASGLNASQINSIDWNQSAYTKYFRVDSMGTTFHYWNLETVVGLLSNGDVLYMNEDKSIIVDASSGDVHESTSAFTASMVPNPEDTEYNPPLVPLAPDGSYSHKLEKDNSTGGYIYYVDLGSSQNEYYINSDLVCIGWQITTEAGIAAYSFNDPGFENVIDEALPGMAGEFNAP